MIKSLLILLSSCWLVSASVPLWCFMEGGTPPASTWYEPTTLYANGTALSNCVFFIKGDGETSTVGSNATWHGSASYVAGKIGTAFNLTGGNWLTVPASSGLAMTNYLTVEFWVKSTNWTSAGYNAVVSRAPALVAGEWFFIQRGGNNGGEVSSGGVNTMANWGAGWDTASAYTAAWSPAPVTLTNSTWVHIAAVFDGFAQTESIYSNGVLSSTFTSSFSGPLAFNNLGYPLVIGAYEPGGAFAFRGHVNELAIYRAALSGSQISAIYQAGTNNLGKTLTP